MLQESLLTPEAREAISSYEGTYTLTSEEAGFVLAAVMYATDKFLTSGRFGNFYLGLDLTDKLVFQVADNAAKFVDEHPEFKEQMEAEASRLKLLS